MHAVQEGLISVLSTSNNTIITLADTEGHVKAWASAGTLGFTHSRKKTVHAAEAVAAHMGERVLFHPCTLVYIVACRCCKEAAAVRTRHRMYPMCCGRGGV